MSEFENYMNIKYRNDTMFQKINKNFLTLSDENIRVNNEHLKIVEDEFIPLLKKDELFATLFKRIMYGGSYYKGTRYGKPEEFDLDFIMKLPINYAYLNIDTNHDNYGFIKIKVDTNNRMTPTWNKHVKTLSKWLSPEGYLYQDKFRNWMERIFTLAFQNFNKSSNSGYEILYCEKQYKIKHKKSGPAFTMIITTPEGNNLDIDLVPCLQFDNVPLGNGYKKLNGNIKTWMAISKPLNCIQDSSILWRLCFYEQEKEFLKGDIKPVIKMMKKFRDTMQWKSIASYYIETIFYHELEKHTDDVQFLRTPKTVLFILGLNRLLNYLEKYELPYFWHPHCNLFGKIKVQEQFCYASRLKKLLKRIDNVILTDRYILADVVLTDKEAITIKNISSEFEFTSEPRICTEKPPSDSRWCVIL